MEKYFVKAKYKIRMLVYTALALCLLSAVGIAVCVAIGKFDSMFVWAALILFACGEFIYFFNYDGDFFIDYENHKIIASEINETSKVEAEVYFESLVGAEIIEKHDIATEFKLVKTPSCALILRGTEDNRVIPLVWFSPEQRAEILKKTKEIVGAYL